MKETLQADLKFLDYQVFGYSFEAQSDIENRDHEVEIGVAFDIRQKLDSDRDFLVLLHLKLNQNDSSFKKEKFRLALELGGFFQFEEGLSEETVGQMILLNGLTMLYSTARGVIAQFTAQTPVGKLVIPSINMHQVIQNHMDQLARSKKKTRKSPKKAKAS